ncbi:hypothetical protein E8E13_004170 [Curvularia kusanoi]|uniref:Altered inheritance of mitochondria protein 9, mitochondrial n=1 Tax=Curvularia kusanoi TaxID=90978 RepID=A0A9P4TBX6_CURKU|nr:hypothetical protein E8E13_004170 [Curvularia kusanoi]
MTKEVMSALNHGPEFIQRFSEPVLWHTDLHMGNIYVSEDDPTQIVSIIDWQSIVIAPLFVQARFPLFLQVDEHYLLGTKELPKLPPNYEEMDAEDKRYTEHKLGEAKLAKAWEMGTGREDPDVARSLGVPSFIRNLFLRSARVSEEGVIPLRACLIELSKAWNELGFLTPFPASFTEDDLRRHEQQFQEYRDFQDIHDLAKEFLETDFEGWINPLLDFEVKVQQNKELFQEVMRRSHQYNMSPEEVRRIWPYREHCQT